VIHQDKLVGIISIEDFIGWLADREPDCPIAEKMTPLVQTVYADEPLVRAVNKFDRLGFGRFAVVDRQDGRLVGIITKGDIVEGLLKKLDIHHGIITKGDIVEGLLKKLDIHHLQEEQLYRRRVKHFFDDIAADKVVLLFEYEVAGHDFKQAGEGASRLKATLRRLGLDPQIVRRVAIATYEAEMNLIIYTEGGKIRVRVEPHEIFVKVEDAGPGIEDVQRVLKPGYSTAPEWVRNLGFGAGMGLSNILKCATKMDLTSTVGKGTQLFIRVSVEDGAKSEAV